MSECMFLDIDCVCDNGSSEYCGKECPFIDYSRCSFFEEEEYDE